MLAIHIIIQDIGKHFNYFEKDDIGYYEVATPFTELFAKSTFEQGQILDALISINFNPNYNLTLAHKGYKSLGKYKSIKSRGNQFRLSSIFNSNNSLTNVRSIFLNKLLIILFQIEKVIKYKMKMGHMK